MKALQEYDRKRDFKKTSEPVGKVAKKKKKVLSFVVQEHHASHLHYDFRLELDGVLKSWAVPKGPSPDPKEKRLAMQVEDHPLAYGKFAGMIPEGEYGGGEVLLWDHGSWEPNGEPHAGLKKGHLDFILKGARMKGRWTLIRTGKSASKPMWLLFKRSDEFAGKDKLFHALKDYGSKKEAPEDTKKKLKPITRLTKMEKNSKIKKNAVKKKLDFVDPQLSHLVDAPPTGDEWVHEIKFDGYRIQALIENGNVRLLTRSGLDWTDRYTNIADSLKKIDANDAILDGEVVALDTEGRSDFQELQVAMKSKKSHKLKYYIFDLMECDGEDYRGRPLTERKEKLKSILPSQSTELKYSEHLETDGSKMLAASCEQGLEGIISKQKDSAYTSGRTQLWVKSKCTKRQEFVIGGYSEPQGARNRFGALLLGVYENGKFRYVGRCGTGFNAKSIEMVWQKIKKIKMKTSAFELNAPRDQDNHYVKPTLVAEIAFANWTREGVLRVPVFHGLREDKMPKKIIREVESAVKKLVKKAETKVAKKDRVGEMPTLTHPDKIIYAKEKITKQAIAAYYEVVALWMLPQMKDRPLSLMRCPEGTSKTCFYQKHLTPVQRGRGAVQAVHEVIIEENSGKKSYATVDSAEGLVTLVQSGGFEFHAWGCRAPDVAHPDQIVMDFDPSREVGFAEVKRAAFELKEILDHLKLKSFVKVTGGKGLHVHIPVATIYTWDQIKDFSKVLAQKMVEDAPNRYTSVLSKAKRKNKIFVDYLRNGRGATAVVPYSLRAREMSAVALPITWDELKKIKDPAGFTLQKTLAVLKKRKSDPWKGLEKLKQKISLF
jgi:bifunctional non-homologous end joining protein LigD